MRHQIVDPGRAAFGALGATDTALGETGALRRVELAQACGKPGVAKLRPKVMERGACA